MIFFHVSFVYLSIKFASASCSIACYRITLVPTQANPGSLPSAQEVMVNERRIRREQQLRLESLGELSQWIVDEAGNDYLAVMLKFNGTILFLDLAQQDWVNRKSGTTLTELLGRDRWPRAFGVAPLTDEEVTLPNSIEEFPGDFDSPRYGFRKQWQEYVRARASSNVVGAPSLVVPSTQSLAGAGYAVPGHCALGTWSVAAGGSEGLDWIGLGGSASSVDCCLFCAVTSTVASAAAPLPSSREQQPGGPSARKFVFTVAACSSTTVVTQSLVSAATAWVASMQQLVAAAPVFSASSSTQARPLAVGRSRIPVPDSLRLLEWPLNRSDSSVDLQRLRQSSHRCRPDRFRMAPRQPVLSSLPVRQAPQQNKWT